MIHLFPSPPHSGLQACVIVPAKNEAERLQTCLTALSSQVDLEGHPLPPESWEILLLVNNSTDRSSAIARRFSEAHPRLRLHVAECNFATEQAHIGEVRRLLMDSACHRLAQHPNPDSAILSTDADTEVAPDWIAQNLNEIARGAQAVGGRILFRSSDLSQLDSKTRDIQRWNDRYNLLASWLEHHCDPQAHDPWPRHHQHFGGSFAVTPAAYRSVGGLPPKEFLEDLALYRNLIRQDLPFRHSWKVRVHTSARLHGRTEVGLAEQLTRWNTGSDAVHVPSVRFLKNLFSLSRRLRNAWQQNRAAAVSAPLDLQKLAIDCGTDIEALKAALTNRWFGAAFESLRIEEALGRRFGEDRLQPLRAAVAELQSIADSTPGGLGPPAQEAQSDTAPL